MKHVARQIGTHDLSIIRSFKAFREKA